jgi:hypothetical protein
MKNYIKHSYLRPLSKEFEGAEFNDERLRYRLIEIADCLALSPGQSFPKSLGNESSREGFYRFLRNDNVEMAAILEPHFEETCQRIAEEEDVLILYDTTKFSFTAETDREGLGWINTKTKSKGFFGHFALAVSDSATHLPLGVVGLRTIFRTGRPNGKGKGSQKRRGKSHEGRRWEELKDEVVARVGRTVNLTHVTDREADIYDYLANMTTNGESFVARVKYDRKIAETDLVEGKTLTESFMGFTFFGERVAPISRRIKEGSAKKNRFHPPRNERSAKLAFSANQVEVLSPERSDKKLPKSIAINVVRIHEIDCPEGEAPIEWVLYTQKPIDTAEQVEKIVDTYRARWIIEEYFKSLKTGCDYENRQLESKKTLLNALAILIPIAWRMLALRTLGRSHPTEDAAVALSNSQLLVLQKIYKMKHNKQLSSKPTVGEAMVAVAALGGHIKNNGLPGWQVLWRGFQDLLLYEAGWAAATERCDQ